MTKIIFVRHGQTEWNVLGRYQARRTSHSRHSASSRPRSSRHIFRSTRSSRLLERPRARDEDGQLRRRPLRPDGRAAPRAARAQLRRLGGTDVRQIVAKWPDALENFFQHPDVLEIPHGESFPKLRERALACVEEIVARHPDQTVAVFAHGAILRTILTAALHMDLQYVWTIRQFNTAVNIVTYTEHGTTVELINGTGHLKYTQEPVD